MGKTRDLFKKIRDTKGTFHAKIGTIKDRNGMNLTEAEDIKKRWQEYTEELYKTDLNDPGNQDGVITDLEPDILKGEVKWALGCTTTNKASGGDGIPVELFQIRKDDAVKGLHSICQQIWKTQQWPQDWKKSVFIPMPNKTMPKSAQMPTQLHSIAQAEIKIAERNINNLRYTDDTTLMAESEEELKCLLMKVKEESEKVGLKLNIKKTMIMASSPITSWQIGKQWKQCQTLFWGAPKSLQMVTAAMKLKDTCSLDENLDQPRQHIKKQRHYFASKGPSSQSYGFSSSHVWM